MGWKRASSARGRLRLLTPADLADLAPTCPRCPLGDGVHAGHDSTWAPAAQRRWGMCGVALVDGDEPVAHLLVSPALTVPRGHPLNGRPLQADQAILTAVRLPEAEDEVVGRQLVQRLAAALSADDRTSAIVTVAGSGTSDCRCPSRNWLGAVGFHAVADTRPEQWHLDLTRTLRWVPHVSIAWERARAWLRPVSPPEPTGRAARPLTHVGG